MDPDAPSPAPAAAHPPPPRPPGDAASVTVREDRGGDATSEKAAGESESDVRARVGGEEHGSKGDDGGNQGTAAATPNTFTFKAGSEGARPDDDVAPAEEAGGGEPGGGASRLPSDGGYRGGGRGGGRTGSGCTSRRRNFRSCRGRRKTEIERKRMR